MKPIVRVVLALAVVSALSACAANDSDAVDLPPAALEGRDVMRSKGCASCHGRNGAGGVGPGFVGLAGSQRPLEGGGMVLADRDYLVESIVDPQAKIVEGYRLPMPSSQLSDAEVDAVVAYIEALAEVSP